jgi:hypothetical protein
MILEYSSTQSLFDIRLKRVLGRSLDGRRIDLNDGRRQKICRLLEAGWFSCVASESDETVCSQNCTLYKQCVL